MRAAYPLGAAAAAPRAVRSRAAALPVCLGVGAGLSDLLVGLYMNLGLGVIASDAMSRVANAFYVLYSRDPHLAAIGFVWNPLPSLLEMPLLTLRSLWPALATQGVAAIFVSAAFGGIGVFFLTRTLSRLGLPAWVQTALALLYACNPLILFYGANGMSDGMFVAATLAAMDGALRHVQERDLGGLTQAAWWLAVAFLLRYEAIPLALMLGLGIAWSLSLRRESKRLAGTLLLLLAPAGYAVFVWMYLNWLIVKSPIYFIVSPYGNASQTATGAFSHGFAPLQSTHGHPLAAALYVLRFALLFWPVLPGLAYMLWRSLGKRADPRAPLLLLAALATPALQVLLLTLGKSAGWDRFFLGYIPFGFLCIALWAAEGQTARRWRHALGAFAVILAVLGDAGTAAALTTPTLGHQDGPLLAAVAHGTVQHHYSERDAIVRYLDRHPHLTVLCDSFDAYPIIVRLKNPRQLVITSDLNFQSILENPLGRIDAILVPEPTPYAVPDAVNRAWPALWSGGVAWAHLLREFPGGHQFRLYTVTGSAP